MIDAKLRDIRQRNLVPVPLLPNSKQPNEVKGWDLKFWADHEFRPNNNIGANLALSGVLHVDADNKHSEHFCKKFLPQNTLIIGRKHKIGKVEIETPTNWFYKKINVLNTMAKLYWSLDAKDKQLFMEKLPSKIIQIFFVKDILLTMQI